MSPAKPLSKEEFAALGMIAKARQDNLRSMFSGASIVYGQKMDTAKDIVKGGIKAGKNASDAVKGGVSVAQESTGALRQAAQNMIVEAVGIDNIGDLLVALTGEAIQHLIAEMLPYVGILVSGGKAAAAWTAVIKAARHELKWDNYVKGIGSGDPIAACAAVEKILKRNIARDTTDATIHTAAVASKIAGTVGDFGTGASTSVIGLATGLASLAVMLTQLGIDIREMRAGNKLLAAPQTIDRTVFDACPLLGSYLIVYSPASMVLNFFVADIGLPGWMSKIEKFKKEGLDPLVEVAADQIERSRIKVVGFTSGKGYVPDKTMSQKLSSISYANFKFQWNRVVRSKLPF